MSLRILTALAILSCLPALTEDPKAQITPAGPTPVAVLCDGDDSSTAGVCEATKNIFSKSPDFTLGLKNQPRILIVRIPTNVTWKEIKGRIKVFYKVKFALLDGRDYARDNEQTIDTASGSCWEDNFKDCATQIFLRTKKVVGDGKTLGTGGK